MGAKRPEGDLSPSYEFNRVMQDALGNLLNRSQDGLSYLNGNNWLDNGNWNYGAHL